MSQILIKLVTHVSVIPDAVKTAIFVLCELFLLALVLSPFFLTEKDGEADGTVSQAPSQGCEGA